MKKENWRKQLKLEFGIHFKNSPDELHFLESFIEDLLEKQREGELEYKKAMDDVMDNKRYFRKHYENTRTRFYSIIIDKINNKWCIHCRNFSGEEVAFCKETLEKAIETLKEELRSF